MKRAIIVGASGALGGETCKILIDKGYDIVGVSRTKPSVGSYVHIDLTDEKSIESAADVVSKKFSEFDCIINCVGVMNIHAADEINFKDADNIFKVNVIGPMVFISYLMSLIKKNNADILNVGSTVGFKAYESQCAYSSSKFGENLRLELKDTRCRVIGFNPGGFKSKIFEKGTGKKVDLTGYMEPAEIAKLLVHILELPKNMEVSDILINRKK